MTKIYGGVEIILFVVGAAVCSAFFVARVVLMAYDELRQTWRKTKTQ